jgi:hypothetical protein
MSTVSLKLVAVRSDGRRAGHVIARAALDEIRLVRMPEENEGRPCVEGAGVAGDLPAPLQQRLDRDGLFRSGENGARKREGRLADDESAPQSDEFRHVVPRPFF